MRTALLTVSVLAGCANAALVRHAGRPPATALISGALMALFVWWGTRRVRKFLGRADGAPLAHAARSAKGRGGGTPVRGWANPSSSQRLTRRIGRWFSHSRIARERRDHRR